MDRDTHGSCWCLRLQEHQWTSKGFKVFHHIEHQWGSLLLAERMLQTLPNFQIPSFNNTVYTSLHSTVWAETSKLWTDFAFYVAGKLAALQHSISFQIGNIEFCVLWLYLLLCYFYVINSPMISWAESTSAEFYGA